MLYNTRLKERRLKISILKKVAYQSLLCDVFERSSLKRDLLLNQLSKS